MLIVGGAGEILVEFLCAMAVDPSHCLLEARASIRVRQTVMRERDIFIEALQKETPAEREAYLAVECAGDAALRQRVEELLAEHHKEGSFFLDGAPPGFDATSEQPLTERPGTQIGPYKLLQQIGEGGMGVVYMAEQTAPIARRVALKVIKPGMDTRQVIARFEAERQALAIMDHVNIARVLDAGTTEQGRPFFVMELVHGVPITQYCDNQRLTPRQRLELFVSVCQAIQHAHQKGIIHRDIKPTNVLVALYDGQPVPKVIDFGVAKAIEQKLTERTLFTQYGTLVGTPEYMSPEQAEVSALGVDTRSDIYSLGVLLYELLTGSTPLGTRRMKQAAYAEILRMIKEDEPPKPSTRLSDSGEAIASISANRHTEPAKLTKLVRGELDWIVMKTLEKDRNRRYETASGFAADVQRYLNDEPVQACPPSRIYRFGKFTRRNKRALAIAGLVLFFVVLLGGGTGWAVRDRTAREVEFARQQELKRIAVEREVSLARTEAEQLQQQGKWPEALSAAKRAEGLLAVGGSKELREQIIQLRTGLQMIQRLDEFRSWWADHPGHETQDREYARVFAEFGIDVKSLSPAEAAARIRRWPGTAVPVAAGLDEWAMILRDWTIAQPDRKHDPAKWKGLLEVARLADPDPWRSELRKLMGREDPEALRKLADSSDIAALPVQSLELMGTALIFGGDGHACVAWLRRAHRQHPGDALISFHLAFHLSHLPSAEWADVLRFAEAALAGRPQSVSMYRMVRFALERLGRYDEAIMICRRILELKPDDANAHSHLAMALAGQGKLDEAVAAYETAVELDPKLAMANDNSAVVLKEYREAIVSHPNQAARFISQALNNAAWQLATHSDPKARNPDRALELAKEAVGLTPDAHWNTLGVAHYRVGDCQAAVEALKQSMKGRSGGDAYDWFFLAMAHSQLGNEQEARKWYDQAVLWMEEYKPKSDELRRFKAEAQVARLTKAHELQEDDLSLRIQLGNSQSDAGDFHSALAQLSEVINRDPKLVDAWVARGNCYFRWGEFAEAAKDFSEAIKLNPDHAASWTGRAFASLSLHHWDDAVADYSKAIDLAPQVHTNWYHRGHAYLSLAQWDKAAEDFTVVVEGWPNESFGWYLRALTYAHDHPDKALSDLHRAIATGFNNLSRLKNDSQLDPLRNREDFRTLLIELEQKQK